MSPGPYDIPPPMMYDVPPQGPPPIMPNDFGPMFGMPSSRTNMAEVSRYTLNNDPILSKIKTYLTGKYKRTWTEENGEQKSEEVIVGTPLMNDDGVNDTLAAVHGFTTMNTVMSATDDSNMIIRNVRLFHTVLGGMYAENYEKYGLDLNKARWVSHMCAKFIYDTMMRPINRGESRLVYDSEQRRYISADPTGNNPVNNSMLGKIFAR